MKYAYSPLLRAPDRAIDVDMEKPAVVRMMKAMCRARQKELSLEWTRQRGVRLERTEYPGLDGEKIPLFVITPAEENAGGTEPGGGEPVGARDDGTHDETKVGGGEPVGVRDGMRGGCPAMIYLHGGAFALPVQQSALELAAVYAKALRMPVFLPEYRLLPEYSGGTIWEDCLALWRWLDRDENAEKYALDRERMLLYGESAGGALAAGLTLWRRDQRKRLPAGVLLVYPVLDDRDGDTGQGKNGKEETGQGGQGGTGNRYASRTLYEEAAWSARSNASMWSVYLKGAREEQLKYLVPMRHPDVSGFPQTYIEPQEFDILRDEAVEFGRKLANAGTICRTNVISGSYHSFDADLESELVQRVLGERISEMRKMLGT